MTLLKRTNLKMMILERKSEKYQVWTGRIWKGTIPKRKHLKKDSFGKETTVKGHFWTGRSLKWQFWKGIEKGRILERTNLAKDILEMNNLRKDRSEKKNLAVNESDTTVNKSDIAVNKSDIAVNTVQMTTCGRGVERFSYVPGCSR